MGIGRRVRRGALATCAVVALGGVSVAAAAAAVPGGPLGAGTDPNDAASIEVRPIDEIVEGEIVVEPDPSGRVATLTVETTIPVACAVIYGVDESFGMIAVDSDMDGGAHTTHRPLLTDLEPDTEYVFIVQGSDASGTIYRSEPMTFRTPAAPDTPFGENLALDATVVDASSSFSDGFAPELAIDGNLGTEWSSAGDGDDAWIEFDLGDEHEIAAVTFRTREMTDGTAITETFTVTIDGTTFGPFPTGPDPIELDEPVTGQLVRFDAEETTGGNTGAVEVEVLAP